MPIDKTSELREQVNRLLSDMAADARGDEPHLPLPPLPDGWADGFIDGYVEGALSAAKSAPQEAPGLWNIYVDDLNKAAACLRVTSPRSSLADRLAEIGGRLLAIEKSQPQKAQVAAVDDYAEVKAERNNLLSIQRRNETSIAALKARLSEEKAWVIERTFNHQFTGEYISTRLSPSREQPDKKARFVPCWTKDINQALRFSNDISAHNAVPLLVGASDAGIAEHIWPSSEAISAAIAAKEVICKSSAAEAADRARIDDLLRLIGIGVMYCLQSDSSDAREWASGIPLEFIGGEPKMKEPPK